MPANISYEYATVRVVPRVEREEFLNAGVVLFCLQRRFLQCRIAVDEVRLRTLWPWAEVHALHAHLTRLCCGSLSQKAAARASNAASSGDRAATAELWLSPEAACPAAS